VIIGAAAGAFRAGAAVVSQLTRGPTFVCAAPGATISLPDNERVRTVYFAGPHPAGLPGTHIHMLDPVSASRVVWHLGYQDVIAIGELFTTGRLDVRRTVALAGPLMRNPRLVQTHLGANLMDLVTDELTATDGRRVISGSVLCGRRAGEYDGFLGRYHQQITAIAEERVHRLFGWVGAMSPAPSFIAPRWWRAPVRAMTTALNGAPSAMVPLEAFERVMPLDILPAPLMRALLVRDTDAAQDLGALELAEEDVALTSFVCAAKYDYGALLRANLSQIEREG
jgi:Na+-transporting NADH:ubiquinone oxidoreductase subunit A